MRTKFFYNNLYSGLGYEPVLQSALLGLGLEAHKPVADLGFDITAYSQKTIVFPNTKQPLKANTQLWFQVKSATVFKNEGVISERMGNAGIQKNVEKEFYFDKDALKVIMNTSNAYAVFYFGSESKKPLIQFWLSSKELTELFNGTKGTFFNQSFDNPNCVVLKAIYQGQIDATEKIRERLEKILQEVSPNNYSLKNKISSLLNSVLKSTITYNEPAKIILLPESETYKPIILDQLHLDIRNIF